MAHTAVNRIGIALLDSDISLEPELARALTGEVPAHFARIDYPGSVTTESLAVAAEHLIRACGQLVKTRPDVLIYACTSGSFFAGPEHSSELRTRVANATGIPMFTAMDAVQHSLERLRAKRVAIVSPYDTAMTGRLVAHLDELGVETISTHLLVGDRVVDDVELQNVPAHVLKQACLEASASSPDAVFVSCTGVRILDLVEDLEKATGVPCFSSNIAIVRLMLDLTERTMPTAFGAVLKLPTTQRKADPDHG